ncbi:MAG: UDP-2,3-diacetamido-2,3-dideoxy-D-glucuronate 2-epimerase [Chlamydiae bacterium]|nr:UDP-2,3-diacetamido-2,3-dideoxy-D-glucuronate 2-epimerase [Chlamydiota bacterium]
MKVLAVVGARPNFMKMAPLLAAMKESSKIDPLLLHTGQHYDYKMSEVFFENLGLSEPDITLQCGGGSHAEQTAKIMLAFEPILLQNPVDLLLVAGDVNSTLACTLVASKLHIPIAHIEAGLRSFDRQMPEEINRIVTDSISDFLFTTCEEANQNLLKEGIDSSKIFFVGNLMIDTLLQLLPKARASSIHTKLGCSGSYGLVTLHRPSNVDSKESFNSILSALETIQKELPLIWPLHPRTKRAIERDGQSQRISSMKNLQLIEPLGYLENLALMERAKVVLTDSGGIQEETTVLNVPCLTLRQNTERPITITHGTNRLVGSQTKSILQGFNELRATSKSVPPLWDGQTASRIVKILEEDFT